MKLKTTLMSVVLLGVSCTNQSQEFSIEKFYPLSPFCDGTSNVDDVIAGNGLLDVAAGSPQFFIGARITGAQNVVQQPVMVGQVTLEQANRNRPLVNQQIVTYRLSKRVGTAPKPYITNISLPFSEDGAIFGTFQLISPELGQALVDNLVAPAGPAPNGRIEDFVDISADVEFRGEFSASKSPFSTGVLTFPIRAYKSLPVTCPLVADSTGAMVDPGYVKFLEIPAGSMVIDPCAYVGQQSTQLVPPAVPACCTAIGPSGGAGC